MTKPTYEELAAQVERLRDTENERNEIAAYVWSLKNELRVLIDHCNTIEEPGAVIELAENMLSETPAYAIKRIKEQWNCPTIENGKNRYGLDVAYFRRLFNRELNRSLSDYKPSELARNLLRMARTADNSIIAEDEFTGEMKKQWQADFLATISQKLSSAQNSGFIEIPKSVETHTDFIKWLNETQEPTND